MKDNIIFCSIGPAFPRWLVATEPRSRSRGIDRGAKAVGASVSAAGPWLADRTAGAVGSRNELRWPGDQGGADRAHVSEVARARSSGDRWCSGHRWQFRTVAEARWSTGRPRLSRKMSGAKLRQLLLPAQAGGARGLWHSGFQRP